MAKVNSFGERENEVICTLLFEAKHLVEIFACLHLQNSVIVSLPLAWPNWIDPDLAKCQWWLRFTLNKINELCLRDHRLKCKAEETWLD